MESIETRNTKVSGDGHARWILRGGLALFVISLANGLLIEALPLVRLALSAHLVGLLGAAFLVGIGAVWPRLRHSERSAKVSAILALYGFVGGWFLYFSAAVLGAGGLFPIASGAARGSDLAEAVIGFGMATVALALLALCLRLWRAL
jgi:hypothetical protein